MPLKDHFRPPLSQCRHWDSFHCAWAEAIVRELNRDLLPEQYHAETHVKLGKQSKSDGVGSVADTTDVFEVQVLADQGEPRLVSCIELVSPAHKDRRRDRQMFVAMCMSYLQRGIGVIIVDVVTNQSGNLHAELLRLLDEKDAVPAQGQQDLYATAYRSLTVRGSHQLQVWVQLLDLGNALPTLPLWISPEQAMPVDLEQTYLAACTARRIG
jgi:hypothetical protein